MGLVTAQLILKNPCRTELRPVEALADIGSVHSWLPIHVQIQLGLGEIARKECDFDCEVMSIRLRCGPRHRGPGASEA